MFGLLIAYYTYGWIEGIASGYPDAFSKGVLYVGFFAMCIAMILVRPFVLASAEEPYTPVGALVGFCVFFGSALVLPVLANIINSLEGLTDYAASGMASIVPIFYIILAVLMVIIAPFFFIVAFEPPQRIEVG